MNFFTLSSYNLPTVNRIVYVTQYYVVLKSILNGVNVSFAKLKQDNKNFKRLIFWIEPGFE